MFSNSRDAMNVIIEHYLADGNLSDCYHKKTDLPSGIFFFSSYFLRAIFISMLIRSIQAAMISDHTPLCTITGTTWPCGDEVIPVTSSRREDIGGTCSGPDSSLFDSQLMHTVTSSGPHT
jgi:hypothetical protein